MQTSVTNIFLATGIPGEFSRSQNQETRGAMLDSAVEANNVVGRVVFTVDGSDYNVGVAADGNIAGILCSPKSSVRPSLSPQAFLPNDTQVQVAESGYMFVTVAAAAAPGDFVYYSDTTGAIATAAPATAAPAGHSRLPGGTVKGLNVTAAGIAEIQFDLTGSTVKTTT